MHLLRHLFRDRRGSAALEFALLAPVMLLLYYGMAEITQGLLANRRVGHVAAAVGDLVAQGSNYTVAQIDDIFNVSTALMKPMPTGDLAVRVTSISIDANKVATVNWSQTRGSIAPLSGTVTGEVPAAFLVAGDNVVRADTTFTFTSALQQVLPAPIIFRHTTHLRPRDVGAVTRTN